MRRPITLRARLTLLFAAATAAVLLVVGLAVFVLFSLGITGSIDDGLRQRARALDVIARDEHDPVEIRADSGERLLQLYAAGRDAARRGRDALGTTPSCRARRSGAPRGPRSSGELEHSPAGEEARIRAFGVDGGRVVAVIGESLDREHDLRVRLAVLLVIVLPAALLAASYLGYRLAGAALAPVERMRARAARITDSDLSERLPLPESQDEIARLGRTFNGLLDRLAAAIARERRIVSDASHELRTPLAVLSAELQVAARPGRSPAQQHEAVVSALEETGRLSRLADDLLVLARSDEGNLPLRVEPLDVGDVLRDLARRNDADRPCRRAQPDDARRDPGGRGRARRPRPRRPGARQPRRKRAASRRRRDHRARDLTRPRHRRAQRGRRGAGLRRRARPGVRALQPG